MADSMHDTRGRATDSSFVVETGLISFGPDASANRRPHMFLVFNTFSEPSVRLNLGALIQATYFVGVLFILGYYRQGFNALLHRYCHTEVNASSLHTVNQSM